MYDCTSSFWTITEIDLLFVGNALLDGVRMAEIVENCWELFYDLCVQYSMFKMCQWWACG